jgi:dienelactone hydrolase
MNLKKLSSVLFLIVFISISLFAMKEIPLNIPGHGYDIPAILIVPDGAETEFPGVVMVHGFASYKDEVGNFYKRLAEKLAANGIASVRFDFPGSGDHKLGFEKTDISLQIRDTRIVLDWFIDNKNINAEKIGLLGFSLGGFVSIHVASNDTRVKALALWSTPGNMADAQVDLYNEYYPQTLENEYVVVDLGWRTINLTKEYFESAYASYPHYEIRKYKNPLLAIAGELDGKQPNAARRFVMNAGNYDSRMVIIPEGDHIYQVLSEDQTMSEKVIDITNNWFNDIF